MLFTTGPESVLKLLLTLTFSDSTFKYINLFSLLLATSDHRIHIYSTRFHRQTIVCCQRQDRAVVVMPTSSSVLRVRVFQRVGGVINTSTAQTQRMRTIAVSLTVHLLFDEYISFSLLVLTYEATN
jgi:hypothetical protein